MCAPCRAMCLLSVLRYVPDDGGAVETDEEWT
jgi:hypothetical protein